MTVKLGISLRNETHAAATRAAKAEGVPLSSFIDRAIAREIYRREVAEHNTMLRDGGAAAPDELRARVEARRARHRDWRASQDGSDREGSA